jgi:mono/diheme cytochrome c family protein
MTRRHWLLALAPLALGLAAAMLVLAVDPPRRSAGVDRYIIPAGTADRVRAGLPVDDVLPQRIGTVVGRALLVENADSVNHVFGPFVLAPGQSWERRFATAGDYSVACSVYPATGFTIAVAPSAARAGPAELAQRLALLGWAAVAALTLGALGLDMVQGGTKPQTRREFVAEVASPAAAQSPPSDTAATLLTESVLPLPGATVALLLLSLVALSRVAPWRTVLASPVAMAGLAAVLLAAGATLFVRRVLGPDVVPPADPARQTLGAAVLWLSAVAGWWMATAGSAAGWALMTAGAGLLAIAVLSAARPRSRRLALAAAMRRWLAAVGCALFVAGLPWPTGNPAQVALAGGLMLLCALVLLALAAWAGARPAPDAAAVDGRHGARWLATGGGLLVLVLASGALLLATSGHIEATTIPLAGNPVPASIDSSARGAALWTQECAACHSTLADVDVTERTDRELLAVITAGLPAMAGRPGMPGYGYRLDLAERGDLVNYLRARKED